MKSLAQAEKWQSHGLKPGLSGFLITALPGICMACSAVPGTWKGFREGC